MKASLSRRDFLKLTGLANLGLALRPWTRRSLAPGAASGSRPNLLMIVFDAFSAYHLPLLGYPRNTTPNIDRLAARSITYHRHYSAGNYTTPGTASLLTGTLPWTHRALALNSKVEHALAHKTIFSTLRDYHRIAYTHNPVADVFLRQADSDLEEHVPLSSLMLTGDTLASGPFGNDEDIADVAWIRGMKKDLDGYTYSLFLSSLYDRYIRHKIAAVKPRFPRGIPSVRGDNYYQLSDAIDWLQNELDRMPGPYFAYFHFMPPHAPYAPEQEFYRRFDGDQYSPPSKPDDLFSDHFPADDLLRKRMAYDEFVLNLDFEFGRLFDHLERSGALDKTWVVLTSDHGELFERGFRGHGNPLLYEGVIRVPLMIFEPGRTSPLDVHDLTSSVDLLPTLAHIMDAGPTDWSEGKILPPYSTQPPDPSRSLFAVQALTTPIGERIREGTVALIKGDHKLTYFFGYKELEGTERVELYNVQADPDELNELSPSQPALRDQLLAELKGRLAEADKPYS